MNEFDLAQALTIAANVGVIAGIIFLGIELRQNNQYMAAEAKYNMHQNQVSLLDLIASSGELSQLMVRATAREELSPAERLRLTVLAVKTLSNWRWEFEEYQAGRLKLEQLPLSTWQATFNGKVGLFPLPLAEVWSFPSSFRLNPAFIEFMEENVIES